MSDIDISKEWVSVTLRDIGEIVTGSTPPTSNREFYGNDFPFYKPADLNAGRIISQTKDGLSKLGLENSRILPKNSVLVVCIGGSIGKTSMISKEGASNQQINAIIPNSEIIIPKFLYYILISPKFQNQIISNSRTTSIPILNKSKFGKLEFYLPSKKLQMKIVKKLDHVFSILENKNNEVLELKGGIVKNMQNSQKILLEYILLKRMKLENFPNLPRDWKIKQISDIGKVITGLTPATSESQNYGNEYPFFKPGDLNTGFNVISSKSHLSKKGMKISRLLPSKSILVVCIGATIGKVGFIRTEGASNQQINAIIPNSEVLPEYVYFWFNTSIGFRTIIDKSRFTTLPIIKKSSFEKLTLPIPPKDEQKKIIMMIQNDMNKMDVLSIKNEKIIQMQNKIIKHIEKIQLQIMDSVFSRKTILN